jgi:uncharacterized protein (TIGR00255 family)
MIDSMTGYASRQFTFKDETYKIELKSLNHRFLDLKLRTPRDFNPLDASLKSLVEKHIKRGSVDVWIERQTSQKQSASRVQVNAEQARMAFEVLSKLKNQFQLEEGVSVRDIINFPDVIEKSSATEFSPEELSSLEGLVLDELKKSLHDLVAMRKQEGEKLRIALLGIISHFKLAHQKFLEMRVVIGARAQEKIKRRIEQCFEAYGTTDERLRAMMETRIAQEIAYSLEKLDIEEELTRFRGHIEQIEALLNSGGSVGKKLDFMFQELNREINTLGNKSQDLGISQEVIQLKMWIEQMREQSLNLE